MAHLFDHSQSRTAVNTDIGYMWLQGESFVVLGVDFFDPLRNGILRTPIQVIHEPVGNTYSHTIIDVVVGTGGEGGLASDYYAQPWISGGKRHLIPEGFFDHQVRYTMAMIRDGGAEGTYIRLDGAVLMNRPLFDRGPARPPDEWGEAREIAQRMVLETADFVHRHVQGIESTPLPELGVITTETWYAGQSGRPHMHNQVQFTPDARSTLVLADFFEPMEPPSVETGESGLPYIRSSLDLQRVFGATEDVHVVLTGHDDAFTMWSGFSARTLRVEAGAGDDMLSFTGRQDDYGDAPTPRRLELFGGDGNDIIYALVNEYTLLDGGAGDDELRIMDDETQRPPLPGGALPLVEMRGGDGNDGLAGAAFARNLLYGDAGDDYISGGRYGDLIHGGDGDDTIGGGGENDVEGDTIYGGAGNDRITGSNRDDILHGDAGDDTLEGGMGHDTLIGGPGLDSYFFRGGGALTSARVVDDGGTLDFLTYDRWPTGSSNREFDLRRDGQALVITHSMFGTITVETYYDNPDGWVARGYGAAGPQYWELRASAAPFDISRAALIASEGPDLLRGTDRADTIRGLGGNDTIRGGAGDDDIGGGPGDDLIFGDSGRNVIWGGHGNDTIHGGSDSDTIHGGGNGTNHLFGHDGDDLIHAGDGGDLIGGGAGNDTIRGGAGNDTIYGWHGDDNIGGGAGNDLIFGSFGRNIIWGGWGDDTVQGGEGSDTIHGGGNGTNRLFGNDGDDLIFAGDGGDFIGGGAGNDTIRGGAGADTIYGGTGNDDLAGGAGNDIIFGSAGNNTIWGGAGNDTIHSGTGRDVMNGGPGADVFVFASAAHIGIGAARDVISDFTSGLDRIDLSALGTRFNGTAGVLGGGQASFYHFAAGGLLIGDQTGNGVADWVLQLTGAPGLTSADFIL